MTTHRRFLITLATALAVSGMASASSIPVEQTIGYESTTSSASAYSLSLNTFNDEGGSLILDSVTLYFSAIENVTNMTLASTDPSNTDTFDFEVQTNFVKNFSNSADASDLFSGETVQVFDTGIGGALGNCSANPDTTLPPDNGCNSIVLTPLQSVNYAPYSLANTDSDYGLTTGTGDEGLFGVMLSGTTLSDYIDGSGTFTLSGTVQSSQGGDEVGSGVDNSTLTEQGNTIVEAEVDYTYHEADVSSTPEPATMALMGGALLGLGLLRKRFKKS